MVGFDVVLRVCVAGVLLKVMLAGEQAPIAPPSASAATQPSLLN